MSNKTPITSAIIVRATRDFIVGPYHKNAINNRSERAVQVDTHGTFWTTTEDGHAFGSCQVGHGWEIIAGQVPFSMRGWLSRLF